MAEKELGWGCLTAYGGLLRSGWLVVSLAWHCISQVQRDVVTVRLMFIPSRPVSQCDNVSVEESAFCAKSCRLQR